MYAVLKRKTIEIGQTLEEVEEVEEEEETFVESI